MIKKKISPLFGQSEMDLFQRDSNFNALNYHVVIIDNTTYRLSRRAVRVSCDISGFQMLAKNCNYLVTGEPLNYRNQQLVFSLTRIQFDFDTWYLGEVNSGFQRLEIPFQQTLEFWFQVFKLLLANFELFQGRFRRSRRS